MTSLLTRPGATAPGRPPGAPLSADRRGRLRASGSRATLTAWAFILPVVALHLFTVALPAASGIYYSFTDWSGIGKAKWTGLANYQRLLQDGDFLTALANNVKWLLFFWTVPFVLAMTAAFLLSQVRRGATFYRLVYFIPYVLPSVVVASTWKFILNPDKGLPSFLASFGIQGFDKALLGQESTALWTIAFIDNWHYWGFLATLLLVAMQGVPTELYEAARLDGANLWHQLLNVTIPAIRPTLIFMFLMTGMWSFLVFDYVWVLTQGGPAGSSEVLGTLVYKTAFAEFDAGYAAAQGVSMAIFASLLLGLFTLMRKRGWEI